MNPLIKLLLIALGAFCVIVLVALACSVVMLAWGKHYSKKQFEMLKNRISQLLGGDDALAQRLLEGEALPEACENREQIETILNDYRAEQERIAQTSLEQQKNRPKKRRILKLLTEKKDRGEWI